MADDPISRAIQSRHPNYNSMAAQWQYYGDHYTGGPLYSRKPNPLAAQEALLRVGNMGAKNYLWQFPVEPKDQYDHRLNRASYINFIKPVVNFYASTVGGQDNVLIDQDDKFLDFMDNIDLQGQSYLQFMDRVRKSAAIYGHTFILIDQTRATEEIRTAADVKRLGVRPYAVEIKPIDMLNWRLDAEGRATEILYRISIDPPGSIMESTGTESRSWEYRFWNTTEWRVYRQTEANGPYVQVDAGPHKIGSVPLAVLYHEREEAMSGCSLLADAAKLAQLLTNWVSALDQAFESQMFAVPVLESTSTPSEVGVGVASVLHLNPEAKEKFSYAAPDTAPFEASWAAFFRLLAMAMGQMGLARGTAMTAEGDTAAKQASGISKQWDFFEAEKILIRMANNEQEVAKQVMELAGAWMGVEYKGSIQYGTRFDLSTIAEDLANLVTAASAGIPIEARKELVRRVVFKLLPSIEEEKRKDIDDAIDMMDITPEMSLGSMPGAFGAGGGGSPFTRGPAGSDGDDDGQDQG